METIISKEDFIETIETLKKVDDYSDELNIVFKKYGADGYLFQPDCHDAVVKLLHIIFGDMDKDEWISYFIHELEYGKKWKSGVVCDVNGADISISNSSELYDFLLSDDNLKREVTSN